MKGQSNNNNKLFFDALKVRNDLNFKSNKRILYTNIQKIDSFDQKYKKTNLTLNFIIRNVLYISYGSTILGLLFSLQWLDTHVVVYEISELFIPKKTMELYFYSGFSTFMVAPSFVE